MPPLSLQRLIMGCEIKNKVWSEYFFKKWLVGRGGGGGKDFTQSIHLKLFGVQVGRTKRKLRGMHPFSLSLYISYICISHISVYLSLYNFGKRRLCSCPRKTWCYWTTTLNFTAFPFILRVTLPHEHMKSALKTSCPKVEKLSFWE